MSTAPLMSEYPEDKKHPIDESDVELVVGADSAVPERRCFWSRFRRGGGCCRREEGQRKNKCRRAFRLLLAGLFVLGGLFLWARHHMHGHMKMHPITCYPITTGSSEVYLPLHDKFTRIGLHSSLSAGDVSITHPSDAANGTVHISYDLPKDSELLDDKGEAKFFECHIVGPHFVSVGIHSRSKCKKAPQPKAISTKVELPACEAGEPRGISLWGQHRPWFGHHGRGPKHGCYKKRIQKAIKKAIEASREHKLNDLMVDYIHVDADEMIDEPHK